MSKYRLIIFLIAYSCTYCLPANADKPTKVWGTIINNTSYLVYLQPYASWMNQYLVRLPSSVLQPRSGQNQSTFILDWNKPSLQNVLTAEDTVPTFTYRDDANNGCTFMFNTWNNGQVCWSEAKPMGEYRCIVESSGGQNTPCMMTFTITR